MLQPLSDDWSIRHAAHLLRRAGFGGTPEDIARLHAMGRSAAVDSLLNPQEPEDAFPIPEWAEPERAVANARAKAADIEAASAPHPELSAEQADHLNRRTRQKYLNQAKQRINETRGWWFRRMLQGTAPLREKMVIFWHDHFATSVQKVNQPVPIFRQNQLFRDHALGSFRELTHAVVRDPAMMVYLDIQNSRRSNPNENFPREVMELFTLGAGNYTETDIKEAARAFTGYRIEKFYDTVTHNERQWDNGQKTVFGESGKFDGDDIVDLIFSQPQAAKMLPAKVWEYFVSEDPAGDLLNELAASFKVADFRVAPLLRQIFLSEEFYAESVMRNQIKSPVQYLVQLFKELDLDAVPPAYVLSSQQQLGQVLLAPPNVAGWDWGKGWINTNTLLTRYNIAGFITCGAEDPPGSAVPQAGSVERGAGEGGMTMADAPELPQRVSRNWKGPDYETLVPRGLREDPAAVVDALILRFFQDPLPEKQRATFTQYAVSKKGAIFTNHEVAELCYLMLSTPAYQLA